MEITPPVLSALKKAVDQAGNPTRFSKETGIRQTTIRNWLLGITKSISEENWRRISDLLEISASNLENMHRALDQIGPDPDLLMLLALWKKMDEDLRKRLKDLINEAVSRDVVPDMLDFLGLCNLPEEEKNHFLEKYGGLQKLKVLCSSGALDENVLYDEVRSMVKKHPEITTEYDEIGLFLQKHPGYDRLTDGEKKHKKAKQKKK